MSDLRDAIYRHRNPIPPSSKSDAGPYDEPTEVVIATVRATPQGKVGWMKAKLLNFVLGAAGKKLDGHRTKLSGAAFILLGLVGFVGNMFPDQGLPEMTVVEAWGAFAFGLGLIGVGGKADKLKDAITGNP